MSLLPRLYFDFSDIYYSLVSEQQAGRQASSTYLLHGQEQRPQNFPRSFKFFSASFMSLLIWSIPSSMRSSCSDYQHIVIFPAKERKHVRREERRKEVAGGRKGGEQRGETKEKRQKKTLTVTRETSDITITTTSTGQARAWGSWPVPTF